VLADGLRDPAFAAEALALPAEQVLAEEVVAARRRHRPRGHPPRAPQPASPSRGRTARDFESTWQALAPNEPYAPDGAQVGRRALRNACLAYLADADAAAVLPRLLAQLHEGGNMTDVIAALGILANQDLPERETALAASMPNGRTRRWWSTSGSRCNPPRACPAPARGCAR
jgi:aminopeptidase N